MLSASKRRSACVCTTPVTSAKPILEPPGNAPAASTSAAKSAPGIRHDEPRPRRWPAVRGEQPFSRSARITLRFLPTGIQQSDPSSSGGRPSQVVRISFIKSHGSGYEETAVNARRCLPARARRAPTAVTSAVPTVVVIRKFSCSPLDRLYSMLILVCSAKPAQYPYGYPGDEFGAKSVPHHECHECKTKFPGNSTDGTVCSNCSHPKCSSCQRLKPRRVEPEPDPEILRSVEARIAALRVG